ncbi:ABC-type nitrate/sulfonate/bicarbonate transport system permease component [Actinocorallia herbida]|uniref:ABC-type nitrate/sulfonate/bicarbonate transport system permease component n=1 Tax=Actinocorallia herbida TaxID=58109 RepID=A0A3N1CV92_9ACTN|nr:ABC transporter permease [Actinocorallia herbida]ROO85212.1 ABC-type nitrate/sulfonate/bicarbonate transport system permease component [Actinocorallia herbida]
MTADAPGRGGRRHRPLPAWALGALGLAGLVATVEAAPRIGLVDERYLPPFSAMAAALAEQTGQREFWVSLTETLRGWALGLVLATLAGVALGLLVGALPPLRAALTSTIEFLRPIPSVALIPLAVLLFGTDMRSTLLLVVYASFWQVLVQVLYGVRDVDPVARETARSFRFRQFTRIRTVLWPTALPYAMTGFRLGAAVALILEITGELVIGSPGLGAQIAVAQTSGAVAAMYALVIVVGLIGVAVNAAARAAERRVLRWHPSVRGEAVA